jgi:hypothetical protein
MPRCSELSCQEDFISFDDLTQHEKHDCIGIKHSNGNDMCTTCDNVKGLRSSANSQNFNNNPLSIIFGINNATKNQINDFWEDLYNVCNIKQSKLAGETLHLPEPNLKDSKINYELILRRMSTNEQIKVGNYVDAIQEIVELYSDFVPLMTDTEYSHTEIISKARKDILFILEKHDLKCVSIHEPLMLPFASALFLQIWADSSTFKFTKVVAFFKSSPSACYEATIESASNILTKPIPKQKKNTKTKQKKNTKTKQK